MLHRRIRAALGAVALVGAPAAVVVATAGPASAGSFTVTSTADGGSGSLREAIETLAVNSDDTVVLQAGATYQLTCEGGGQLTHGSTDLTIEGNGATIEQTCEGERVLDQGSAPLSLEGVTLTGGNTDGPGAGVRTSGSLDVLDSTIHGNLSGTSAGGGAIATVGDADMTVTVRSSTLNDNTARNGGAIAVTTTTDVVVINSTITDNHAFGGVDTGVGGALSTNGGTDVTLIYATVVGNTAESGFGGNFSIGSESDIVVLQSVIADGSCSLNGNSVTSSYNVTTESSCGLEDPTDETVTDAMLAPLGAYGGPTRTMEPLVGSPVIDVVPDAACPVDELDITTDQRGLPRPDVAGRPCDAGAVEVQAAVTPVNPTNPPAASPVAVTPAFTG